jgi:hypothetical protein
MFVLDSKQTVTMFVQAVMPKALALLQFILAARRRSAALTSAVTQQYCFLLSSSSFSRSPSQS